jgi:hypothetical protein
MLKRVLVIFAFAASIGLAACSPAATTAPTVGPLVTDQPLATDTAAPSTAP